MQIRNAQPCSARSTYPSLDTARVVDASGACAHDAPLCTGPQAAACRWGKLPHEPQHSVTAQTAHGPRNRCAAFAHRRAWRTRHRLVRHAPAL